MHLVLTTLLSLLLLLLSPLALASPTSPSLQERSPPKLPAPWILPLSADWHSKVHPDDTMWETFAAQMHDSKRSVNVEPKPAAPPPPPAAPPAPGKTVQKRDVPPSRNYQETNKAAEQVKDGGARVNVKPNEGESDADWAKRLVPPGSKILSMQVDWRTKSTAFFVVEVANRGQLFMVADPTRL
ncbi:MAG: hypothetical protein Q9191_007918, partial [Dirinaria sp. TL-2023a]